MTRNLFENNGFDADTSPLIGPSVIKHHPKMKPTTLFALAALIATCSFAAAEEKPQKGPKGPKGPPPELVKEFDKDGNGSLSDDEKSAMKTAMEAKRKEMLEKYDADKDGKLSPDERKAAVAAGEKLPGHGPRKGKKGKKGEP